jgi:Mg-chelatase subunit ChlD
MPLELTHPLCLFGLAALPVVIWYYVWSLSDFPRRQRQIALFIRSLIVVLMVLACAGLTWLHSTSERYVMFIVDQSQSIGEAGQVAIRDYLRAAKQAAGSQKVGLMTFAAEPGDVDSDLTKDLPAASPATGLAMGSAVSLAQPGTDIASAIEAAAAYLPPGFVSEIVLLSDGRATRGDALQAALKVRVPISTLPLPSRTEPEVQVSSVSVPAQVREGEPFFVDVVIDSNHDDEGLIEVFRGDHKVVSEVKTFRSGENKFRFQQSIERERLAEFTVHVSGLKQDTLLDNNREAGLVYTAGKPRVLIVESDPNLIRDLAYALEQEEIQVDIRPPQGMPESLADMQNYELLILSNVPATAITHRQMEVTRTYVQELGGGFIMLGGEQSFGLGGYYKTVIEEILPVRSDFEKEKEKPSMAMVLVIDKSGSMSGEKLEMAKTAARSAVEVLGQSDKVCVIAFDGEPYIISEMQSASAKAKISDEISRIEVGGGTIMYPAMEQGFEVLQQTVAKLKHMILLTDGISAPGDFEGLSQQMASLKMTVSTVAMGNDCDTQMLELIAREGKGRYYLSEEPSQIPQIFAKETITASKAAINEQPFVPQVIRSSRALADLEFESAPFLLGYVMTRPKPTCELILATEKGDPLLAWWRYGLGMTAAFTSDAKARWSAEWITWPGYGEFWTQLVRHLMRKSEAQGLVVQTRQHSSFTEITVDAVDPTGRFLNQATIDMTVITPRLASSKVALSQTAPGRYSHQIETPLPGAYHLELTAKLGDKIAARQSRGLSIGYSEELRLKPTDEEGLRVLANHTGGIFRPKPEELFAPTSRTTQRPTPLWSTLISIAAVLLVLDVALRRIDFSLWPIFAKLAVS